VSGYKQWEQKSHAEQYLVFEKNIGEFLSIDEVSLSKGELYTFLTNKSGRGKRGSLVASIQGTKSHEIIEVLNKLPLNKRLGVKEITLDMANNMEYAVKKVFPNALLVTDRFHVIRLVMEALQHCRIDYRWQALDEENKAIKEARNLKQKYKPYMFENGDTRKQLLARTKYSLAKKPNEWTTHQKQRMTLLFKNYPLLENAYKHTLQLRSIYEEVQKSKASERLRQWITQTHKNKFEMFTTVAHTIENNYVSILNFFNHRNTNANAESFNAKVKLFRANLRGVTDTPFFLFRLMKLFA